MPTNETHSRPERTRIRWHNSLIVRVAVLCAVLVLCLLGSVYIMTGHYYHEVVREMDERATELAHSVEIWLEEHPEEEILPDSIPDDLATLSDGAPLELELVPKLSEPSRIAPRLTEEGYVFMATQYFERDGQWVRLTARFAVDPQTEVVRAFKNRNLVALSVGFLLTLGLMIYLIAKTLRPLRELSESCAEISSGNLKDVTVRGNSGEVLALEETFNRMVGSLREKEVVEANLRQAQRLSAIGNLAAGVAHDVRNPLNAIKLLSGHAIDTLQDSGTKETAVKQLQTIRREVHRLEEIVSGFLSLAKEEELRPELRQIDSILEECLALVRKDAEARDIRLADELRAGDTALMIDPKQWTRAILNVLINALEACPPGGRVRLFSRITDRACEVEIRDDGPGMTKEQLERAFDPYYTTKKTGTGLGLSIMRGIVEEHGGSVTLSSTPGHGCQVLISVPLEVPVAEAPGEGAQRSQS